MWDKASGFLTAVAARTRVPGPVRTIMGILALACVLVFFMQRVGQDLAAMRQAWESVNWLYLALSFVLLVICLLAMALIWYGLLRSLGGRLPVLMAVRFYGLTLLPRYAPGMVWGYAGRTLLCEREGVSRKVSTRSIVVEVGLIVGSGVAVALLRYLGASWIACVGMPGVVVVSGLLLSRSTHRRKLFMRLTKAATWYGWTLAYIGFWLLYGASNWLIALSFAPQLGTSHAPDVVVSAATAWLAGFVIVFVPSGLGIREGVFALALTPLVGVAASVYIPLAARLFGMLSEAMFSFLCLVSSRQFRGETQPL